MPALASIVLTVFPACIVTLWAVRTFPWAARRVPSVIAAFVAFAVLQTSTYWIDVATHSAVAAAVHIAVVTAAVTLAIASVPLSVWMVVPRRADRAPPPPEATGLTRRQVLDASAGMALFGATGSMLAWGVVRGRHGFQLTEVPIAIAGLPRALDGYVIAHVSDIHAGVFVAERDIDEGLELVQRARADLLVVTGDLVDNDARFAPFVARKLRTAEPRDGIFACLGNHDYYAGARKVTEILTAAKITTLVNDGRVVRPDDGGGFALLGVDDLASRRRRGGGPQLDRAVSAVPPNVPRILLSHRPPTVDRWAGRVALQLSGHTHGGQINPGGILEPMFEYIAGRYAVRGTTLYVSRGFGTVGPPARVGSPPEVTRIVLVAA